MSFSKFVCINCQCSKKKIYNNLTIIIMIIIVLSLKNMFNNIFGENFFIQVKFYFTIKITFNQENIFLTREIVCILVVNFNQNYCIVICQTL